MYIHTIFHNKAEKLGAIKPWALTHGHSISSTNCEHNDPFPENLDNIDCVITLGGPQSAVRINDYPYLLKEVAFLQKAISAGKRVLGFCLGAQLIGIALGAPAEKSPHKEIGMFPVRFNHEDSLLSQSFPEQLNVMHWHGDMTGIPEGAVVLASSEGCSRQVIRFKDHVYGFQCHPEVTKDNVQEFIDAFYDRVKPGTYIQTVEQLKNNDYAKPNQHLEKFLNNFLSK